jgi:hypothetical protein
MLTTHIRNCDFDKLLLLQLVHSFLKAVHTAGKKKMRNNVRRREIEPSLPSSLGVVRFVRKSSLVIIISKLYVTLLLVHLGPAESRLDVPDICFLSARKTSFTNKTLPVVKLNGIGAIRDRFFDFVLIPSVNK